MLGGVLQLTRVTKKKRIKIHREAQRAYKNDVLPNENRRPWTPSDVPWEMVTLFNTLRLTVFRERALERHMDFFFFPFDALIFFFGPPPQFFNPIRYALNRTHSGARIPLFFSLERERVRYFILFMFIFFFLLVFFYGGVSRCGSKSSDVEVRTCVVL